MKNVNQEILILLDKYGSDYKRALKENKKLEYLYALAELRENLLEWYDFKREGRLLQVGADYGALTGLFLGSVKSVTVLDEQEEGLEVVNARYRGAKNLELREGTLTGYAVELTADQGKREMKPAGGAAETQDFTGYDVITLIGALREEEPVEAQLEAAKQLLAPNGVLLLAACNRFGIKYFAGAGQEEVCVTKRGLERMLPGSRFYYPMPDYKLPSEIYSDQYLPKKGDLTGALAVYDYPEYLLMDVGAAYDAVCEDGQFDNFANSYLAVWEKGE